MKIQHDQKKYKRASIHLLVSTVVTDGLVDDMAPGLFFAVLMIFSFALFIVDRVALFDPLGFGHGDFVLTAFLTLDFFHLADHGNSYRMANLKTFLITKL